MSKNNYLLIGLIIILILGSSVFNDYSSKNRDSNIQIAVVNALNDENSLFQVSTLNDLSNGDYDGIMTFEELKKHGDVGLGTFEGLDGEMIELDNIFYQIKSNGTVYVVNDSMKTPFTLVTFFKPERTLSLNKTLNNSEMEQYLNNSLYSKNKFHAIKIQGVFKHIKARSVPKQNKPYPPLSAALKNQTIFKFTNINGTIIGFWSPQSANGIDPPGYHFHFISADKKSGGHVLEYEPQTVEIGIDPISKFYLVLPENNIFRIFNGYEDIAIN